MMINKKKYIIELVNKNLLINILDSKDASATWRSDFNDIRASDLTNLYSKVKQQIKLGRTDGAFLARGHMVPDADGTFKTWQDATYTYHNAVPQWQVCYNINYLISKATTEEIICSKKGKNLINQLRKEFFSTQFETSIIKLSKLFHFKFYLK
jgi:hypothetical protein